MASFSRFEGRIPVSLSSSICENLTFIERAELVEDVEGVFFYLFFSLSVYGVNLRIVLGSFKNAKRVKR